MIEDAWDRVGKRYLCRIHLVYFDNMKKCPKCYPASFPVENGKKTKGVLSERRTPLSSNEKKAYDLHKKGASFKTISDKLNCSKSMAFDYVKKAEGVYKADKGVALPNDKGFINKSRTYKGIVDNKNIYKGVRLHNDSVSFLIEPIDLSMERDCVKLKYSKYKLINTKTEHIQIFPNKLIVLFLEDIEADTEDACLVKANERIKSFLSNFKYSIIKFLGDEWVIVSRHYAIIGSDLARHFVKSKKKIIITNIDGKGVRARVDFSHRKPELEFENIKTGGDDSKVWTSIIKDSVENDIDLLSVTKKKTDLLMNDFLESKEVLKGYMEQIKLHMVVENKTNKVLDKNNVIQEKLLESMEKMNITLKAIQESVKR